MDDPRVTDEMVEAALDKWYPGEDWRKVLEENLDRYRAEMRAAILAALDAQVTNVATGISDGRHLTPAEQQAMHNALRNSVADVPDPRDAEIARLTAEVAALEEMLFTALPQAAPKPAGRKIVQIAATPNELYCLDNDGKLWFIPDGYSDLRAGPPLPAPEGEG